MINAPYISKLPRRMIESSDYELIRKIKHEFENAFHAKKWQLDHLFECWKFVFQAAGECWDEEATNYKRDRGMRTAQYDLIGPKVNTFAGMMIADEYDFRYDPVTQERNSAIVALEDAASCDRELMHFPYNWSLFIRDGVICEGEMEVTVDNTIDPRGNIAFKRCVPGRWIRDPYWKEDQDEYCEKAWKHGNIELTKFAQIFKKLPDSEIYLEKLKHVKRSGMDWTDPQIDEMNTVNPTMNDTYHVIEYHWIEEVNTKRIIAMSADGLWVPFPVTEDRDRLERFAMQNNIVDWVSGAQVVPYQDKVHYSATVCTDLFPYDLLEYGKPEIQIKGLPIVQFTCERDIIGRNRGIVGPLMDIQLDLNYGKAKVHEYLANSLGGAFLYDKNRIPSATDREDLEKNHNDPTRAFAVDGPPGNMIAHVNNFQISPDLINHITGSYDDADRVSQVSAAMQSQTQSANEPASLYQAKLQVNKVGTMTRDERVKYAFRRLAEAYYWQTQITYAGSERTFTSRDGKKKSVLNKDMGNGLILNRVEDIPRCSVTISEAPGNLSKIAREQTELQALLKITPPDYRESVARIVKELSQTGKYSQEFKEGINDAISLEIIKARIASMAEIAGGNANKAQANLAALNSEMQIKQLLGQLMSPQPAQQIPEQLSPNNVGQATQPVGE